MSFGEFIRKYDLPNNGDSFVIWLFYAFKTAMREDRKC